MAVAYASGSSRSQKNKYGAQVVAKGHTMTGMEESLEPDFQQLLRQTFPRALQAVKDFLPP